MKKEFHIFAGHFGSGKTELAINFAVKQANLGEKVSIVDFDTVNPYFRTNDAKAILESHKIQVIASEFACSNIDMPTVPAEIMRVFNDESNIVILDVGGDDDGACALGVYREIIKRCKYRMYFVANMMRLVTRTADDLEEMYTSIEHASGLQFTDIINNTNLAKETDNTVLLSGQREIEKLAEKRHIDNIHQSGSYDVVKDLENAFIIDKFYMTKPWEMT